MPEYIPPAFAEFPAAGQACRRVQKATEETAKSMLVPPTGPKEPASCIWRGAAVSRDHRRRPREGLRPDLHVLARASRPSALVLGSETNKVLTHSSIGAGVPLSARVPDLCR
jgi:hypothetical protein